MRGSAEDFSVTEYINHLKLDLYLMKVPHRIKQVAMNQFEQRHVLHVMKELTLSKPAVFKFLSGSQTNKSSLIFKSFTAISKLLQTRWPSTLIS